MQGVYPEQNAYNWGDVKYVKSCAGIRGPGKDKIQ